MAGLDEYPSHPRLVRPFVGVGVLGGFTTFSSYSVDTHQLLAADAPVLALSYLLGTLVVALLAVQIGITVTRTLIRRRRGDKAQL